MYTYVLLRNDMYIDITLGAVVGSGGAATVYRGEWQGKTVAVKMLKKVAKRCEQSNTCPRTRTHTSNMRAHT